MQNKHQKHNKLKRPIKGEYHNNEWAIYGTNCDDIFNFYQYIEKLIPYSSCFVDANHGTIKFGSIQQFGKKQYKATQKILWNSFNDKLESQRYDYIIINGNHFPSSRQIVIINPDKKDSLERRIEELNNIEYIITDSENDIFSFLFDKISEDTKIITNNSIDLFVQSFIEDLQKSIPEVYALILAGGKSTRMGQDKSKLIYHEKTQEIHLAELCNQLELPTFISKSDTSESSIGNFPIVPDTFKNMGPMGAILSAFQKHPDKAWLVLACDLPLITTNDIENLLHFRKISKYASAYTKDQFAFPEPLACIYEPRAYKRLLEFLSLGYSCPRKILINSDIEKVYPENSESLMNANSPSDVQKIIEILNGE